MLATTAQRPVTVHVQNIGAAMDQIHSLTVSAIETKNTVYALRVLSLSRGVYAYSRKAGPSTVGLSIHVQTRMAQLKSANLIPSNASLV